MKEELYLDFDLDHAQDVPSLLDRYVFYFNNQRRHAALGYKSLTPLWDTKAQFSTRPNWAFLNWWFLCLLSLDRFTAGWFFMLFYSENKAS